MARHTLICLIPGEDSQQLINERLFAGIRKKAVKLRCTVACTADVEDAISLCRQTGENGVIVLTASRSGCRRIAGNLLAAGIHPLLGNMGISEPGLRASQVMPDFTELGWRLTAELLDLGVTKPVFLGWNPESYHDDLRMRGAEAACREAQISLSRIEYRGDLSVLADELLAQRDSWDSVICANDFIARHLMGRITDDSLPPTVSLGGTSDFAGSVLHASIDYEKVGSRIPDTYLFLSRHHFAFDVSIRVPADFGGSRYSWHHFEPDAETDYYRDAAVRDIGRVERILNAASAEDRTIISMLMEDLTYEKIAEQTYMSVRTVKNHTRKLFAMADCRGRKEFCALLRSVRSSASED